MGLLTLALPLIADQPRVEVDEHGANEDIVLVDGVSTDVTFLNVELDDLCVTRSGFFSYGFGDNDSCVVTGLCMRRKRGVKRGVIDWGAVKSDGLELDES